VAARRLEQESQVDLSYKGPSPTRSLMPQMIGPPALLDLLGTLACLAAFQVWKTRGVARWLLAFVAPSLLCGAIALGMMVFGPTGFLDGVIPLALLVWAGQLLVRGLMAGLITGLAFRWASAGNGLP
jgi:hypothetical protein